MAASEQEQLPLSREELYRSEQLLMAREHLVLAKEKSLATAEYQKQQLAIAQEQRLATAKYQKEMLDNANAKRLATSKFEAQQLELLKATHALLKTANEQQLASTKVATDVFHLVHKQLAVAKCALGVAREQADHEFREKPQFLRRLAQRFDGNALLNASYVEASFRAEILQMLRCRPEDAEHLTTLGLLGNLSQYPFY